MPCPLYDSNQSRKCGSKDVSYVLAKTHISEFCESRSKYEECSLFKDTTQSQPTHIDEGDYTTLGEKLRQQLARGSASGLPSCTGEDKLTLTKEEVEAMAWDSPDQVLFRNR